MKKQKIGIIIFPGSNCERDIARVLHQFFAASVQMLWYRESFTAHFDLIVLPGGFSYGDYLRAGAIARFAPIMESLKIHIDQGRTVLGICNGFQILCEAKFLPGALIRNNELKHICRDVNLKVGAENKLTGSLKSDAQYSIPINHGEGNYRVDDVTLKKMHENNQIAFRYNQNPNGSVDDIAGVTDREHKILGMMPHPERAVDPLVGGTDGRDILMSILNRMQ